MALCAISGTLLTPAEVGISGAIVRANIITPNLNSGTGFFLPQEVTTTTASDGTFTISVAQGLSAVIIIDYPPNLTDSSRKLSYSITVPATPTATFASLVTEL